METPQIVGGGQWRRGLSRLEQGMHNKSMKSQSYIWEIHIMIAPKKQEVVSKPHYDLEVFSDTTTELQGSDTVIKHPDWNILHKFSHAVQGKSVSGVGHCILNPSPNPSPTPFLVLASVLPLADPQETFQESLSICNWTPASLVCARGRICSWNLECTGTTFSLPFPPHLSVVEVFSYMTSGNK